MTRNAEYLVVNYNHERSQINYLNDKTLKGLFSGGAELARTDLVFNLRQFEDLFARGSKLPWHMSKLQGPGGVILSRKCPKTTLYTTL